MYAFMSIILKNVEILIQCKCRLSIAFRVEVSFVVLLVLTLSNATNLHGMNKLKNKAFCRHARKSMRKNA